MAAKLLTNNDLSTNIAADAASNLKAATPKAVADYVAGLPSGGASIVEVTKAASDILISNNALVPGQVYKVTGTTGQSGLYVDLFLTALTQNKFALEGQGLFYNPDYQGVGDYSGVNAVTGIGTYKGLYDEYDSSGVIAGDIFKNGAGVYIIVTEVEIDGAQIIVAAFTSVQQGVWTGLKDAKPFSNLTNYVKGDHTHHNGNVYLVLNDISGEDDPFAVGYFQLIGPYVPYVNNQVVIWNGKHWIVRDASAMDGTEPEEGDFAWLMTETINANVLIVGYISELDIINYDYENDWLAGRDDKRGNKIYYSYKENFDGWLGAPPLHSFQSGNDTVLGNILHTGLLNCLNNRGNIIGNVVNTFANLEAGHNEGSILGCTVTSSKSANLNFNTASISNRIYDGRPLVYVANISAPLSNVSQTLVTFETLNTLGKDIVVEFNADGAFRLSIRASDDSPIFLDKRTYVSSPVVNIPSLVSNAHLNFDVVNSTVSKLCFNGGFYQTGQFEDFAYSQGAHTYQIKIEVYP